MLREDDTILQPSNISRLASVNPKSLSIKIVLKECCYRMMNQSNLQRRNEGINLKA